MAGAEAPAYNGHDVDAIPGPDAGGDFSLVSARLLGE
jgi:hypothetical protein